MCQARRKASDARHSPAGMRDLSPYPDVWSTGRQRLAGSIKAAPARSDAGLTVVAPGFPEPLAVRASRGRGALMSNPTLSIRGAPTGDRGARLHGARAKPPPAPGKMGLIRRPARPQQSGPTTPSGLGWREPREPTSQRPYRAPRRDRATAETKRSRSPAQRERTESRPDPDTDHRPPGTH